MFNVKVSIIDPKTNETIISVIVDWNDRSAVRQFAEKANDALRQGFKVETIAA